uniref:Cytochrome P450, family 1, subfamily D, polypeptide 1 n=1 Tax=Paramormyrops kingsleyae TaxID=1676925 RepID=A0A3B3R5M0_9TELE
RGFPLPSSLTRTAALLTMSLFALTIILALGNRTQKDRHLRRPPRPMSWPFIGNLLHVGDQIHISMTNMRDKYGDVFQMRMGSIVVVVLIRQGESFAGRPELFSFSAVANGTTWILHKKICKNALRNVSQAEAKSSTFSCLLEEHVCCEASETVDRLKEHSNCESGFDATIALITSVANVVCALSFGKRYNNIGVIVSPCGPTVSLPRLASRCCWSSRPSCWSLCFPCSLLAS